MAKITTKVLIYVNKYDREVLTEKQIDTVIDDYIKGFYDDAYEVDTEFREMCEARGISHYDIFTMSEEQKATLRKDFEECVRDRANYFIADEYDKNDIEVELEING